MCVLKDLAYISGDLGQAAKKLGRTDECINYFQKRFQIYNAMENHDKFDLILYFENLIEAQMTKKKYEAALITFSKMKNFHLNAEQCKEFDKSEDFVALKAEVDKLYKNMSPAEWSLHIKPGKLWDGIRLLYR